MCILTAWVGYLSLCVCSGVLRPGLNAILGPTGSGKTTWVHSNSAHSHLRLLYAYDSTSNHRYYTVSMIQCGIYPWVMHGSGFFKGEKGHARSESTEPLLIATNLYKTLSPSLIMSRKPLMCTPRVSICTLAELCMWWQCSWQSHLLLYAGLYLFVL